jgi:predicted nucleic acid-binding protein
MIALVDTSIWSLALRRTQEDLNPAEKRLVDGLNELVHAGRARIIGFVRQELLSGIRDASKFETIRVTLREFPDEQVDTQDYEAAAKANNACRAKGVSVTAVDILLCAVAMQRNWAVFASDPDFQHYAKVLPVRLYSVVPR